MQKSSLPVFEVLPELARKLAENPLTLLSAAPGAGKSTVVPPELLKQPFLKNGKIIMLEPRRLAAKLVSARIGDLAGFRVRGESSVNASTRIEVVTEGIFTRQLQNDPELSGVNLVIFDEFHERSIHADLGLALALDVQRSLRPDLKILLMSATLNLADLAKLADEPAVIHSEGRQYPLEIRYRNDRLHDSRVDAAERAVLAALREEEGNALVFLPGSREIEQLAARLKRVLPEHILVYPLYGSLSKASQEQAIAPTQPDFRKVVIATNIAESSITIDGIRIVIDSGVEKKLLYDVNTSLNKLTTRPISKSSAIQRAGRAGRTMPGVVYRLYSAFDYEQFENDPQPEIVCSELSNLLLELAVWGARFDTLDFVTRPPQSHLDDGSDLLKKLGAIDEHDMATQLGKKMVQIPADTRLAAMLFQAFEWKCPELACEVIALLEEPGNLESIDFGDLLHQARQYPTPGYRQLLSQLLKLNHLQYRKHPIDRAAQLLAAAFPEWVALQRSEHSESYLLASGRGAKLPPRHALAHAPCLVAARIDKGEEEGKIQLAMPLDRALLHQVFARHLQHKTQVIFDAERQRVVAEELEFFLELPLSRKAVTPSACESLLLAEIARGKLAKLPWTPAALRLTERVHFAHLTEPENYPDFSMEALEAGLDVWLKPYLEGIRSMAQLQKLDLVQILTNFLTYALKRELDRDYPDCYTTPCGSSIKLDYSQSEAKLSVKIGELYGVKVHPTVGRKKIPLKIELLSPAMRPVQITADLPNFWRNNWVLVQKEMRGRYIKHYWPDHPEEATPSTKSIRRE